MLSREIADAPCPLSAEGGRPRTLPFFSAACMRPPVTTVDPFSSSFPSPDATPPPQRAGSSDLSDRGAGDAAQDLELLKRYRTGDASALSDLLHRYQRRVFGICLRMLHRRDDAPDVAQEALVKVIEGIDSFDGRSLLSTWIIRVTMNCCLSHLRRERLRRTASIEGEMPKAAAGAERMLPPMELEPSGRIQHRESVQVMERALQTLDPDVRAMLILRDLQDLDYEQISRVLGVPLGTVKSRLFRARVALRDALSQLDRTPPSEHVSGDTS